MKQSPYTIIAKKALINWNGCSEEEANKIIEESTYEELEKQVGATNSIESGIEALAEYLAIEQSHKEILKAKVFAKDITTSDEALLSILKNEFKKANKEDMVLFTLSAIHDGWAKKNAEKFNNPKKMHQRYQHAPLEMIGWEEATSDLLFLEPILNFMGVEVDETKLHKKYDEKVVAFFEEKDLLTEYGEVSINKVASALLKGSDFYKPLTEVNTVKDEIQAYQVADQIKVKTKLVLDKNFID